MKSHIVWLILLNQDVIKKIRCTGSSLLHNV